jgi:hypothetical protein
MKVTQRVKGERPRLIEAYNGTVNPPPSTKRGWRRHKGREPEQAKRAEMAWARAERQAVA